MLAKPYKITIAFDPLGFPRQREHSLTLFGAELRSQRKAFKPQ
jgi:hypothetical protein